MGPLTDFDRFSGLSAPLSALVLCGGRSRRMGTDKAVLELGASTLLERAIATVRALTPDVRLACGPRPRYGELGLPLVLDGRVDAGPLAGLEAGFAACPPGLVVVLACDMPNVDPALLTALVGIARRERLDVALVRSEHGLEPLCGVWSTRMGEVVRAALAADELGVTRVLDRPFPDGTAPRVRAVPLGELESAGAAPGSRPPPTSSGPGDSGELRAGRLATANVNTPADLERERRAVAEERATPGSRTMGGP